MGEGFLREGDEVLFYDKLDGFYHKHVFIQKCFRCKNNLVSLLDTDKRPDKFICIPCQENPPPPDVRSVREFRQLYGDLKRDEA